MENRKCNGNSACAFSQVSSIRRFLPPQKGGDVLRTSFICCAVVLYETDKLITIIFATQSKYGTHCVWTSEHVVRRLVASQNTLATLIFLTNTKMTTAKANNTGKLQYLLSGLQLSGNRYIKCLQNFSNAE